MKHLILPTTALLAAIAALGVACGIDPGDSKEATEGQPRGKSDSEERIDTSNDPNRFNLDMVRRYGDLPVTGVSVRKPFPSNWWPMRQGGIARRWNGNNLSPAEKYDQLFNPTGVRDVQLTLAKKDWQNHDVNTTAQPETYHVGPAAEWELRNHGRYGTTDPDSWWGHCNGWSSYVLNEDEPTRAVNVKFDTATKRVSECASATEAGCVHFDLGDINALGSELYWSDGARMLGRRCEQQESEFNFDSSGRINSVECRDSNAGAFHIIATNMVGRMTRPFIIDLQSDQQVWNYPIYRFELTRKDDVTLAQALMEINAPTSTVTWNYNPDATRWVRVQLKAWIVEDSIGPSTMPAGPQLERYTTLEYFDYILELDAAGTILGGEWVGNSKRHHPDFIWYSFSNSAYSASSDDLYDADNNALRYSYFKQILTLAQAPASSLPNGGVLRVATTPALAVPDNDANGIASTAAVSESFTALSARVTVDIAHTYRGDLVVSLEHNGQSQVLSNQEGGADDNISGSFDLTAFTGDVRGDWTLKVIDRAAQDVGTLNSWTLELTRPAGSTGGTGGSTTPLTPSVSPNLAIPDNNTTGITSDLTVNESFNASRVQVTVDITHTYRGDLVVKLIHNGRTVTLADKTGGSADDLKATFEAADFVNQDVRGTWTLSVVDTAKADVGTLNRWSLELARPASTGGTGGTTTVTKIYSATPAAAIPDNNATGISNAITIPDNIRISTLSIEVNITHTYIGDLKVTLTNGTATQTLHANAGGSADNIHTTYDSVVFRNITSAGTWTLQVVDNAAQDVGTLDSWKMTVTGTQL